MPTTDELAARLAIQSLAIQEVMRALAPAQAEQVAKQLGLRVAELSASRMLSADADAAVAGELAALLAATTPGKR